MGRTIRSLAKAPLSNRPVFDRRFVVESCEDFHFHYRNLRIRISYADWPAFAKGFSDAYLRWEKQGRPFGTHTELCRKQIATIPKGDDLQVNLNENLYKKNQGNVFSEGAEFFEEDEYIHLKIRDLRLEMSKAEFLEVADCIAKAKDVLCQEQPS